jgi:hypothetical protein
MCWACDNPGVSRRDHLDHLEGIIADHGWVVQTVEADRAHPSLAYTVGLTPRGQPELVVTGMHIDRALSLLGGVACHVLHDTAPAHGEQISLVGGPLIEIVELREPGAHLHTAAGLYGSAVRAIQLVHADDHGHWPWDRRYRGGRGGQPVLGPRAP